MFRPNLVFLYPTDEVLFAKGVALFLMERLIYPLKKITFSTFEQFNEFEVDSKSWIVAMGKYAHLYPYINSLDSNSLNRILLLTHSYLPLSKKELRHHPFKGIWYVYDINIKNIKGLRRPPNNKFLPRNLESETELVFYATYTIEGDTLTISNDGDSFTAVLNEDYTGLVTNIDGEGECIFVKQ
ncbi:MAG: hypothetical protein ACO3QK_03880 [Flavobacteriaceae bacterium]